MINFFNLYGVALTNGIELHYTEKPIDPSPIRIDLDFRFPLDETSYTKNEEENTKILRRVYNTSHVETIINTYFDIINKYINVPEDANVAYVMEKPNPSEYRNKIKDGIHIVFPHIIVSNNVQHFIRNKILDVANEMFATLPVCNDYASIIDKAIIDVNCWLMYGSKKIESDSYRVSQIYDYDFKKNAISARTDTITAADEIGFIRLFSMRKKKNLKLLYAMSLCLR